MSPEPLEQVCVFGLEKHFFFKVIVYYYERKSFIINL